MQNLTKVYPSCIKLPKTKGACLDMANKPVLVGIARTRPRFDGESPY